ncbi:hypothetical protein IMSHALPRED_009838 [Imshaugia aleurites]|uniref:Uncharacterized protein n=1 Tax=Imshaugia aleurites TaxID=172621 RepID=A0A8H3IYS7_9LECA|nr:hypothetical protein IMSHALPRED_009838 [Imshaugia aleurites]
MATVYSFDHYTESWIEVSSQPSSSSLSSAAADDAGPTGVRVQYDNHGRRRRRLARNEPRPQGFPARVRRASVAGSSQEEYEESESESDRIMTSSNEALEPNSSEGVNSPPGLTTSASDEASSNNAEDDDDENSTALGVVTNEPVFTPQPNAFSHPPQSYNTRHTRSLETRTSYFPAHRSSPHRRPAAHSYPTRARTSHTPYNMLAPSHTADHDAALRASLSTLLSCARALPKRDTQSAQPSSNQVEPSTLSLVPESAITGQPSSSALPPRPSVRHRTSATSLSSNEKGKRKASTSKDRSHRDTRSKKRRANSPGREQQISPTLMTWVVSAGVVVLFSAISFSAGYVVGREVGRFEAGAVSGREGIGCGKEVGRGLRRLRWGGSSGGVVRV